MLEKQASMFVSYDKLTKILKETTDKHAPLKIQKVWDNQAPFMTKEININKLWEDLNLKI